MMTDTNSLAVPTKWTLEDALALIRALQPMCRKFNFHLALGGGVLNNGFSEKDLDLYFLPVRKPTDSDGLLKWLDMWGPCKQIGKGDYPDKLPYTHRLQYVYGKQRIDVFILGIEEIADKAQAAEKVLEPDGYAQRIPPPGPHPYARTALDTNDMNQLGYNNRYIYIDQAGNITEGR